MDKMLDIYRKDVTQNDKSWSNRAITKEPQILTSDLTVVLEI